jgi:hypothetical protein
MLKSKIRGVTATVAFALFACGAAPIHAEKTAPSNTVPLATKAPAPIILDISPDTTILLKKGKVSIEAHVNISGHYAVYISPVQAEELKLKGAGSSALNSFNKKIESTKRKIETVPFKIFYKDTEIGAAAMATLWDPEPQAKYGLASIGAERLGVDIVRFTLNPSTGTEVTRVLPMVKMRKFSSLLGGAGTIIRVGNKSVLVYFDPDLERSTATATVGLAFAASYAGYYSKDVLTAEEENSIRRKRDTVFSSGKRTFETRPFSMLKPVSIAGLPLKELLIVDSGGPDGKRIPDKPIPDFKPDEILVQAKEGKSHVSYPTIQLGRDVWGACSQIIFDYKAEKIQLLCPPA